MDPYRHSRADSQPGLTSDHHQPAKTLTHTIDPAIRRYSAGEISAMKAADLLGPGATVADVFVLTLAANLPLPRPPRDQEKAELQRALRVLGIGDKDGNSQID